MTISSIQLYDLLSEQLGKEKAKTLVDFVELKVDEGLREKTNLFATKEDIASLPAEMKQDKVEIIKWMVGTAIAIISLVIAGIKLL